MAKSSFGLSVNLPRNRYILLILVNFFCEDLHPFLTKIVTVNFVKHNGREIFDIRLQDDIRTSVPVSNNLCLFDPFRDECSCTISSA
jgi:hypothetical protein